MTAEILAPTPENVARAAALLRHGGLVGMPTETVYGLAANAFDEAAVASVFACKERPTFDPLIVHIPGLGALSALVGELTPAARAKVDALAAAFWPGPLTMVLPRGPRVPDLVTSGLDTVAVRAPRHPVAQALLAACGFPLAAPSANRFGRISPTTAAHVAAELGDRLELILDGGPCAVGVESTIVAVSALGELTLLRPGGTPLSALRLVGGAAHAPLASDRPQAPGMLASHYAPRKRLVLHDLQNAPANDWPAHVGVLAFTGMPPDFAAGRQVTLRVLSPTGDLAEAARNLFAMLRALDESPAELLIAERLPADLAEDGLGHAISDRLQRAAAPA